MIAMMPLERFRELLGDTAAGKTDDELLVLRDAAYEWCRCVVAVGRRRALESARASAAKKGAHR